jgi:hypothetical protein
MLFPQTLAGEEITFSYVSHRSLQDDMPTIHNKLELNWQIVCPEGNLNVLKVCLDVT